MALTVTTRYIHPVNYAGTPPTIGGFKRVIVQLTGIGTAAEEETNVVKIDLSTLKNLEGVTPTNVILERIEYNIKGFNYIILSGDHTADTVLTVLPAGRGVIEHDIVDNGSGGTGDVLLSTDGGTDGDSYNIIINARFR